MLKVGFIEIGGCGGCSLSFLMASSYFPKNIKLKFHHIQLDNEYLSEEVDIFFIGGATSLDNEEHIESLLQIREISKSVVAFGSCAAIVGIMQFFVKENSKIKHMPINKFIKCDNSIVGCPPQIGDVMKNMSIAESNSHKFNAYKKIANVKKLNFCNLMDDVVNLKLCVGCKICETVCSTAAIKIVDNTPEIFVEKCIRCGVCYAKCPIIIKLWKKSFRLKSETVLNFTKK
jgi:coenzyme F420 hydrogenase subunit gamma